MLRTVAAEVRKQVSREYGSPQLSKKRGGAHHPVSHPVFISSFQPAGLKLQLASSKVDGRNSVIGLSLDISNAGEFSFNWC